MPSHLTHRGLFLLKISSWVYGYIASCTTASVAIQNTARKDYEKLEQDIHYWLEHDKRQLMQTELQRLAFYNIMKLYSPDDLSLPENRNHLHHALYARFYIQQHSQERIPGTITQAEDESFEHLLLSMQRIPSGALLEKRYPRYLSNYYLIKHRSINQHMNQRVGCIIAWIKMNSAFVLI